MVIDRQAIPGITGGALDSNEGAPGPILLQGDHQPVEYPEHHHHARAVIIRPYPTHDAEVTVLRLSIVDVYCR